MRIDLQSAYEAAAIERSQNANAKSTPDVSQAPVSANLSTGVYVSGLVAKAASTPEIRQDRVEQLRQAISSGTYSVSNEQLADAMLRDALNH